MTTTKNFRTILHPSKIAGLVLAIFVFGCRPAKDPFLDLADAKSKVMQIDDLNRAMELVFSDHPYNLEEFENKVGGGLNRWAKKLGELKNSGEIETVPDDWQLSVLESTASRLLLNCSRQAGKTTVVAVLALVQALFKPMTRVLIVSRSHRQAKEVFRQIRFFHVILREKLLERCTADEMEFTNMSRIVCVPCKEETIRGYAAIDLLIDKLDRQIVKHKEKIKNKHLGESPKRALES